MEYEHFLKSRGAFHFAMCLSRENNFNIFSMQYPNNNTALTYSTNKDCVLQHKH